MPDSAPKDPLHGVTLQMMLERLEERFGWEGLGDRIRIKCFTVDPSMGSSLAFLRRTRGERRRPNHGWDSLTPTELQVVELIRQGLTNRAIAEQLLMGAETVKTHLSHVFTKVGVRNRSALAALATERSAR